MSLGMGGGGTAYVDGYHANFINPANLMINQGNNTNMTIGVMGGLGVKAGGTLMNFSVYNDYLTNGNTINGQLRENMINDWFGSGYSDMKEISTTVNVVPLGFALKKKDYAFSVATRARAIIDADVNRGLAELAFYGADAEKFANPVPVNFVSHSVSFAEISIGYARQVMEIPTLLFARDIKIYAGVAPKYIMGMQSVSMEMNSTLQVTQTTPTQQGKVIHIFDYSLETIGDLSNQLQDFEEARNTQSDANFDDYVDYDGSDAASVQASGFGLDMGVTAEMDVSNTLFFLNFFGDEKILRLSMSLTDFGSIKYDNSASRVYADGIFEYTGAVGEDDPEDYFDNLVDSLDHDIYGNFDSKDLGSIKYTLPGMYNFGASLEVGKLTTAIDYGFGFNDHGTNSKRSVLNLGLEYRFFGFVPVRMGTRIGGYSSAAYSFGLGLDFRHFEFTLAGSTVGNSSNNGSSVSMAWSGLVLRF